jgi:hypothetical protein
MIRMTHLAFAIGQYLLAAVEGAERLIAQVQSGTLDSPCLPVIRGLATGANPNVPNRVAWAGRKTVCAQRQLAFLIEGSAVSVPPRVECNSVLQLWRTIRVVKVQSQYTSEGWTPG